AGEVLEERILLASNESGRAARYTLSVARAVDLTASTPAPTPGHRPQPAGPKPPAAPPTGSGQKPPPPRPPPPRPPTGPRPPTPPPATPPPPPKPPAGDDFDP